MCRLLLVAILSCVAISSFAKRQIILEDRARSLISPVEAFIDEENKDLTLTFGKEHRSARVIITDLSGNTIYSNQIRANDTLVLLLPMINRGEYILYIFFEEVELYGYFNIE